MPNVNNYLELELVDGSRILLQPDWDKVYNAYEKQYTFLHFTKHFPFLSIEKKWCTSFKFRTQYETIDSLADPRFKTPVRLAQLAKMFGMSVQPFEVLAIDSELQEQKQS